MPSDVIRLPGGKVITRTRAAALGLLDANGNIREDLPHDSQAAKALAADRRAAEWRASQGLDKPATPSPKTRTRRAKAADDDIDITPDGVVKKTKKIEPLMPRNVDHDGNPVEDPETLAKIAEETAAIEAAAKAARDAAGDGGE